MDNETLRKSPALLNIKKKLNITHTNKLIQILSSEASIRLLETLCLQLTKNKIDKIWLHTITRWETAANDEEIQTVFSQYDNVMFKNLLNNNGVLFRDQCLRLFKTSYMCDVTAKNLKHMGYIEETTIGNWKKIYFLNVDYVKEVLNDGTEN